MIGAFSTEARRLIEMLIRKAEKELGASMDYLRVIARNSRAAFWKFALFLPLAAHRQRMPVHAWNAAVLLASRHEDCGACVQIAVNKALADGAPGDLVRAMLDGDRARLDEDVLLAMDFAEAVLARDEERSAALRERIVSRHGEAALVDLALGIATARVFPTAKRALGLATACSLVTIELERAARSRA